MTCGRFLSVALLSWLCLPLTVKSSDSVQIRRLSSIGLPGGCAALAVTTINGVPYVVGGKSALSLVNFRNPVQPVLETSVPIPGAQIKGIVLRSSSAMVAAGDAGFFVYQVFPNLLQMAGQINMIGHVNALSVNDSLAVIYHYPNLSVVDLQKPLGPRVRGSVPIFGRESPVVLRDRYAYVGNRKRVIVIDIADLDKPSRTDSISLPDTVFNLSAGGGYLYVSMVNGQINIYNLSRAPRADSAGVIHTGAKGAALTPGDGYLYAAASGRTLLCSGIDRGVSVVAEYREPALLQVAPAIHDRILYASGTDSVFALQLYGLTGTIRPGARTPMSITPQPSIVVNSLGQVVGTRVHPGTRKGTYGTYRGKQIVFLP